MRYSHYCLNYKLLNTTLLVCISIMMMDMGFLSHVNRPLLHYHLIPRIHLLLYFLITMIQILLSVLHIKKEFQISGSHLLGILLMKKIVLKHLLYETKNLIYVAWLYDCTKCYVSVYDVIIYKVLLL